MKVFIAESELHVSDAIRLILEQQSSCKVTGVVSHSEKLLPQVCTNQPDLILLDWNLPGLRLERLMRTLNRNCPNTRVLVTSIDPLNRHSAITGGADGFILKTVAPDEFLQAITSLINKIENENP